MPYTCSRVTHHRNISEQEMLPSMLHLCLQIRAAGKHSMADQQVRLRRNGKYRRDDVAELDSIPLVSRGLLSCRPGGCIRSAIDHGAVH